MKQRAARIISLIAGLLIAGSVAPSSATADTAPAVTLTEFRRQLDDLETKLAPLAEHPERAAELGAAIPPQVTVKTSASQVTVNYRDLKNDLASLAKGDAARREALLPHIQAYLHALAAEAAEYDQETARRTRARSWTKFWRAKNSTAYAGPACSTSG